MKIISVVISVNLVLSFISVYSNPYYVTSFPQIDVYFSKMMRNTLFTKTEVESVQEECEKVTKAVLLVPTIITFQELKRPAEYPHKKPYKLETITLFHPNNVSQDVQAFLCYTLQDGGQMYISSDFGKNTPYFVYYIQIPLTESNKASTNNEVMPVLLGLAESIKKSEYFTNAVDTLYYNQIINNKDKKTKESSPEYNFLVNLYEDQAFRLCTMAFSHIRADHNVASNQVDQVVYTVVPEFVQAGKSGNMIILRPTITTKDDEKMVKEYFIPFPHTLSCTVKSYTTSKFEKFYITPDRKSSTSVFLLKHFKNKTFTLNSHLQDISFLEENKQLREKRSGIQNLRSEDGFLLLK